MLVNEVIKRDVMEGDKADNARRRIGKASSKTSKACSDDSDGKPNGDCQHNGQPAVQAQPGAETATA